MSSVKDAITQAVHRLADELEALSKQIHANPELGYKEVKACASLSEFLGKQGFKVEQGVAGVDTSFRATFEFTGKASHASADPWEGVNALDACVQTYNAVAMLRQQVRPDCRIHGIITSGGAAANIIPESASAIFYVRAPAIDTMWDLYRRVVACAEGAAK